MKKTEPTKERVSETPYFIVLEMNRTRTEDAVNKYIENGWVLVGPAMPINNRDGTISFCQTVVRANVPVK